jgi:hypothetical protein
VHNEAASNFVALARRRASPLRGRFLVEIVNQEVMPVVRDGN